MTTKHLFSALLVAFLSLALTAGAQTTGYRKVVITSPASARLTVFLPTMPSGRAIVDLPGGGYGFLSTTHEGTDWAEWMTGRGITYAVLEYRLPKGDRTRPLGDAYWAMRTMRDSAQAWHLNPYDVGIMGFSAGGHLASAVSTHADWTVRPNFTILFYPVISMHPQRGHHGSSVNFLGEQGCKDDALVREWSSQNKVQRHLTPPAIILLANDDRTVPPVDNGVAYYSSMRRNGNPCALHIYPTGGHGFGFREFAWHDAMLHDLSQWLDALKAPRQDAVRVACIGNSITDGMGIDMSEEFGYPAVLQQRLGDGYQVKNFGVSARTMLNKGDWPYMNEEAWHDALAFRPNVVVIKLGTNDSKPKNWQYGSEFATDLQQMVDSLKALDTHPRILLCTPIKAANNPYGINDSTIVAGVIPAIRKVAKKNKLSIIDLHTLFEATDEQMQGDWIHPTAKGAARMAEIIGKAIEL